MNLAFPLINQRTLSVPRAVLCTLGIVGVLGLLTLWGNPGTAHANGQCNSTGGGTYECPWNCNPQAATSWCYFVNDLGASNHDYYMNESWDAYANHVNKCAAAVRADNGNVYASTCSNAQFVINSYVKLTCCGGLYVRTWNSASGSRNLYSKAFI